MFPEYVFAPCVCSIRTDQRRAFDPQGMGSQMTVSNIVGA